MTLDARLDHWIARWALEPDGEAFASLAGRLRPVLWRGQAAMLKVSTAPEEIAGGALMSWWGGDGAAKVFAREDDALLLERALSPDALAQMARRGDDDAACRILCAAGARLHAPRPAAAPSGLIPLDQRFRALWPVAEARGGAYRRSADLARALLAEQAGPCVLHGDLHHGNVLDFGPRGWLAIDPKGLLGDPGYDYANIFCNPDIETALAPGALERRLACVAQASGLAPVRLLQWVVAYCGLSAAWTLSDGDDPWRALAIADAAAALL
ncbi:aminoglycoside phosphotransferase family protein [Phenylobacterium aquaticum]|uniref:aminoglycoside phosphotransferase family protein n=1 Tax=Phenylobacterium aquaticum TaxID=1763816 RepID=UPI001F5D081E|nr:APH(6) family putative aminoglycoside O-phosphotransferase [Phenylobacterium aquaticum]